MRKFIHIAALFASTACGAQTFDITGYCTEMASRQGLDFAWRHRCISALEVQQKYLDKYQKDQERDARTERLIASNEWLADFLELRGLEAQAKPEDAPLIRARVDQHLARCNALFGKPERCAKLRSDIDSKRQK